MEFWLSYNNLAEKLQLPVNPGEFAVKTGNSNKIVAIQNFGELNLIGTEKLAEIQLSSFFPQNYAPYCAYQDIPEPYAAVEQIEKWRKSGKPIRLTITSPSAAIANLACAVESFEYGECGGSRDVQYTLTLKEYRFPEIQPDNQINRPDTRTAPGLYTVKSGDTLMLIAKRVYDDCSKWQEIFAANKSVIGPDPDLIYPGQQLVVA